MLQISFRARVHRPGKFSFVGNRSSYSSFRIHAGVMAGKTNDHYDEVELPHPRNDDEVSDVHID